MIISPSILSSDFTRLCDTINMLNKSEADWIHCDVMDGVFVPNISFGFPVLKSINKIARKPLDVHLMIVHPERYISQLRDCGTAIMNVHLEASTHLDRTVNAIKSAGMKAAVTLNPATPVSLLVDIITEVDMVLLMSVNPGFGGQSFIPNTLNKVRRLKEMIIESGSDALIEIDGGVNLATGMNLAEAGADVLVAGSAVFKAESPLEYISQLKKI